jgi:hypothetical protein
MGGQGLPSFVNGCSIPCSETGQALGERLEGLTNKAGPTIAAPLQPATESGRIHVTVSRWQERAIHTQRR